MRRTDTLEHEESGRAPENGDLTSAQAVMRRWALFEASTPPFDLPRLLPGGLAQATGFDTPRMHGARAGTVSPEPGIGFGEDGTRTTRCRAIQSLYLRAPEGGTRILETPADEIRDEIIEDRTLRCTAT